MLGTPEYERLKVTALNLFHPAASPLFEKVGLFHITTQSLDGLRKYLLSLGRMCRNGRVRQLSGKRDRQKSEETSERHLITIKVRAST